MGLRPFISGFGFGNFFGVGIHIEMALAWAVDTIGPMQAGVEPLGGIGGGHLVCKHVAHFVKKGFCIFFSIEIATFPAPIRPCTGEAVKDLLSRRFADVAGFLGEFFHGGFVRHGAP